MGLYNLDSPGRAGFDVAVFDGWKLVYIINHFIKEEDLFDEYTRMRFRRALLVSDEYRVMGQRGRFDV